MHPLARMIATKRPRMRTPFADALPLRQESSILDARRSPPATLSYRTLLGGRNSNASARAPSGRARRGSAGEAAASRLQLGRLGARAVARRDAPRLSHHLDRHP